MAKVFDNEEVSSQPVFDKDQTNYQSIIGKDIENQLTENQLKKATSDTNLVNDTQPITHQLLNNQAAQENSSILTPIQAINLPNFTTTQVTNSSNFNSIQATGPNSSNFTSAQATDPSSLTNNRASQMFQNVSEGFDMKPLQQNNDNNSQAPIKLSTTSAVSSQNNEINLNITSPEQIFRPKKLGDVKSFAARIDQGLLNDQGSVQPKRPVSLVDNVQTERQSRNSPVFVDTSQLDDVIEQFLAETSGQSVKPPIKPWLTTPNEALIDAYEPAAPQSTWGPETKSVVKSETLADRSPSTKTRASHTEPVQTRATIVPKTRPKVTDLQPENVTAYDQKASSVYRKNENDILIGQGYSLAESAPPFSANRNEMPTEKTNVFSAQADHPTYFSGNNFRSSDGHYAQANKNYIPENQSSNSYVPGDQSNSSYVPDNCKPQAIVTKTSSTDNNNANGYAARVTNPDNSGYAARVTKLDDAGSEMRKSTADETRSQKVQGSVYSQLPSAAVNSYKENTEFATQRNKDQYGLEKRSDMVKREVQDLSQHWLVIEAERRRLAEQARSQGHGQSNQVQSQPIKGVQMNQKIDLKSVGDNEMLTSSTKNKTVDVEKSNLGLQRKNVADSDGAVSAMNHLAIRNQQQKANAALVNSREFIDANSVLSMENDTVVRTHGERDRQQLTDEAEKFWAQRKIPSLVSYDTSQPINAANSKHTQSNQYPKYSQAPNIIGDANKSQFRSVPESTSVPSTNFSQVNTRYVGNAQDNKSEHQKYLTPNVNIEQNLQPINNVQNNQSEYQKYVPKIEDTVRYNQTTNNAQTFQPEYQKYFPQNTYSTLAGPATKPVNDGVLPAVNNLQAIKGEPYKQYSANYEQQPLKGGAVYGPTNYEQQSLKGGAIYGMPAYSEKPNYSSPANFSAYSSMPTNLSKNPTGYPPQPVASQFSSKSQQLLNDNKPRRELCVSCCMEIGELK